MSRAGPPLFWPSEVAKMTRCAECGGDFSGGSASVRGRIVHRGSCERARPLRNPQVTREVVALFDPARPLSNSAESFLNRFRKFAAQTLIVS